jgi:hypothetical protein
MEQYQATDYQGINYGTEFSNMDVLAGIRFGVIPHGHVGAAWYDDAEAHYGDPSCPECDSAYLADFDPEKHDGYRYEDRSGCADFACENCEIIIDNEQAYPEEPLSWFYNEDGYAMEQLDEVDIFISKSPFFTYAQFCSPCAPGACYLPSPLDHKADDNKCYCLGPEWFEGEKAPYPVFNVMTGKRI